MERGEHRHDGGDDRSDALSQTRAGRGAGVTTDGWAGDSLFETPPGVRVIPAELLLDDPERTAAFDAGDLEESEQLLAGFDPEALIRNTRLDGPRTDADDGPDGHRLGGAPAWRRGRAARGRVPLARRAIGPGARFVYALILITATLGMMALALSWRNAEALMVAGIFTLASSILLWVFWRSWLDGLPYAYRLLTSLGEDAENLLHWRAHRAVAMGLAGGLATVFGRTTRRRAVSRVRAIYR